MNSHVTSKNEYTLVIPYFNEGEAIRHTILAYRELLRNYIDEHYEIIVVDDGSNLQAHHFISDLLSTDVRLIRHEFNKGYGSAISTGIFHSQFNNIIITDSDSTYPAYSLAPLLSEYKNNIGESMVIGSREGSNVHIPFLRRPAKFFLRKFASFLCDYDIRDLNSGLRIFPKDRYYLFASYMPKRFSLSSTLTILFILNSIQVSFVPIDYLRRSGSSSISPLKDTLRFFNLILKLILLSDGMRLFFPSSILFFLFSIFILIVRLLGYNFGIYIGVLSFIAGVQLICFGALCKAINSLQHSIFLIQQSTPKN